jgi:hypothetical protein
MAAPDMVYRVLVGSMEQDDDSGAALARTFREQGHEAIFIGDRGDLDPFVTGAVQEDVDMVSVAVDHGTADAARDYLTSSLATYDADDILVAIEFDTPDLVQDWWQQDGVGSTNASMLAADGIDPDDATYGAVADALIDGYTAKFDDPDKGESIGRSQAKIIRTYNRELFDYQTDADPV